jgi:hypothetical protein
MNSFVDYDPLEKAIMHAMIKEIQQEIKNNPQYFTVLIGLKLHKYIRMNYNSNPFDIPITVCKRDDATYAFLSSFKECNYNEI